MNDDSTDATDWAPSGYDREVIDRVWSSAAPVAGNDAALWRKDEWGAWIHRLDYGRRHSDFGWEIHDPTVGQRGGGTVMALRPMHWQNYLDRLASQTRTRITADGLRNSRKLL